MQLIMVDPRALVPNPDPLRRTKATPQADALLLATIRAVGIVEPPIILPQTGGGNGYVNFCRRSADRPPRDEIDGPIDRGGGDHRRLPALHLAATR